MKFKSEIELIDYVSDKLTKQNCRSVNHLGLCKYRGDNGTKCAAGWLIDDAEYDPDMEGKSAIRLQCSWPVFQPEFMKSIMRLQHIHDCVPVSKWPEAFKELRCGNK